MPLGMNARMRCRLFFLINHLSGRERSINKSTACGGWGVVSRC
jgi:hypothetical protein